MFLASTWAAAWLKVNGHHIRPRIPGIFVAKSLILDGLDDARKEEISVEAGRRTHMLLTSEAQTVRDWNRGLHALLPECAVLDAESAYAELIEHLCLMKFLIYPVILRGATTEGIQGSPETRTLISPDAMDAFRSMNLGQALVQAAKEYQAFQPETGFSTPKDGYLWFGSHLLASRSGPAGRMFSFPDSITLAHLEAEVTLLTIPAISWSRTHPNVPMDAISSAILELSNSLVEAGGMALEREGKTASDVLATGTERAQEMLGNGEGMLASWAQGYATMFGLALEDARWLPALKCARDLYFYQISRLPEPS